MSLNGLCTNPLKQTSFVGRFGAEKNTPKHIAEKAIASGFVLPVEPERIELSSREANIVPSTCLVDFDCRNRQGRQQPQPILSCCVLAALSNVTRSSSALRHREFSAGKTKALSDDGLPDLIGDKLDLTIGQIKQPWRS